MAILRSLSRAGPASAAEISAEIGVPRPTVHRLLLALQDEGLVRRLGTSELFVTGSGVVELAAGWTAEGKALEVASRLAGTIAPHLRWPLDLATYDAGAMSIRFTTYDSSPWSLLPRSPIGRRVPLHGSSPGRIYIASASDPVRASLLEGAGATERALVEAARSEGYAFRSGGLVPRTLSLAVAVTGMSGPILCVCMAFMSSVMTLEAAVGEYLSVLKTIATDTEAAVAAGGL